MKPVLPPPPPPHPLKIRNFILSGTVFVPQYLKTAQAVLVSIISIKGWKNTAWL
jgi:hypothetical protein